MEQHTNNSLDSSICSITIGSRFGYPRNYIPKPAKYKVRFKRANNYFLVLVDGKPLYTIDRITHVVWDKEHTHKVNILFSDELEKIMNLVISFEERLA